MDITVTEAANRGWIVKLGACDVPFRSRADAGLFVERLQERLQAPHDLPPLPSHTPVTQEVQHRP
ncbi:MULTISPECIES: hypothetical protein [unclassified Pseudomonas]|uniref:hypothetical protein n=1 Tax=unclassified Pseudomonas TaxID=196821 RepID=UPI00244A3D74|nr:MULTISPECIES: hypothetical protein [unclassified Pseudomonas]MDG9923671.1 hypothetical protein [Pseudomonas sp. GD04045]MDH0036433.1 hypothetical protein [Pseudomonas sp. GD04019]